MTRRLRVPHPPGAIITEGRQSFPPAKWWRWSCAACGQSETGLERETEAVRKFNAHPCPGGDMSTLAHRCAACLGPRDTRLTCQTCMAAFCSNACQRLHVCPTLNQRKKASS